MSLYDSSLIDAYLDSGASSHMVNNEGSSRALSTVTVSLELWQHRLGHPNTYANEYKSYRCLEPISNRVYTSRHPTQVRATAPSNNVAASLEMALPGLSIDDAAPRSNATASPEPPSLMPLVASVDATTSLVMASASSLIDAAAPQMNVVVSPK
ncbi:hypothetical protein CRG98_029010 [Punica granatum]|uniref:GAG-pre-integrase domain-containing protein n=1 Tax=Punica granatum TaxID=22663 RepID=A0A2I0J3J2_PUNGR|nr:hypothetical protein CRG98_029010 [Punica granatum]